MAYSYSNWSSQSGDAERLRVLRLHIDEVSAQQGPDLGSGGHSRSTWAVMNYLDKLYKQRDMLELRSGERGAGVSVARVR